MMKKSHAKAIGCRVGNRNRSSSNKTDAVEGHQLERIYLWQAPTEQSRRQFDRATTKTVNYVSTGLRHAVT